MVATVQLHPHARDRAVERGAGESEIIATVEGGESFPAKFGPVGFRRNFTYNGVWRGKPYGTKQIEAFAVKDRGWTLAGYHCFSKIFLREMHDEAQLRPWPEYRLPVLAAEDRRRRNYPH